MCENSSASQDFRKISSHVSNLYLALRTMVDKLESDTFSVDCKKQIQDHMKSNFEALYKLQSMLEAYGALPHRSRETWNRLRYEAHEISQVSIDLQSNIDAAKEINHQLEE